MLQILATLPRPNADEYIDWMIDTKRAFSYDVPISDSPIFRNVVFVPLIGNYGINGSMDLGSEAPRTWSEDELTWLELVGRYMGIAISMIQLTTRLEGLSIVQEREYIAQELHDDTVQAISAIMLWAQETGLDLDENRMDAARHALQKIEQGANLAYMNLREEIFGLRHKIRPDDDILAVIQTFLDAFELRWGIHASLRVDNDPALQNALQLPIRTETQVLRIIQEALTNIRKHARATSVEVYVRVSGEWLLFVVQDNGEGFDPQTVSPDHFGLRIMRERAASLGGTVNIDSRTGMGSWVEILIPR
jgi:two-component system nitrate/nitrite sensor histidine kinase NarX